MKAKYIIPLALALVFGGVAFWSLSKSKIEYTSLSRARETGKVSQIIGKCLNKDSAIFVQEKSAFIFRLIDQENKEITVKYSGVKPQNFDMAEQVVAKGKVEGDTLFSSEILTKCPSKYVEEKK